ncbi:MAG: hypothetical protein R2713_00270 [Ilumatobacteraceae bacterium]
MPGRDVITAPGWCGWPSTRRERIIGQAFVAAGIDPGQAEMYGRLAVATLIGGQHRGERTDRAGLRAMFAWMLQSALEQAGCSS